LYFLRVHLHERGYDFTYKLHVLDGIEMEIDSPVGCLDGEDSLVSVIDGASDDLRSNLRIVVRFARVLIKKHQKAQPEQKNS
jgi:hypothetical protein